MSGHKVNIVLISGLLANITQDSRCRLRFPNAASFINKVQKSQAIQ